MFCSTVCNLLSIEILTAVLWVLDSFLFSFAKKNFQKSNFFGRVYIKILLGIQTKQSLIKHFAKIQNCEQNFTTWLSNKSCFLNIITNVLNQQIQVLRSSLLRNFRPHKNCLQKFSFFSSFLEVVKRIYIHKPNILQHQIES